VENFAVSSFVISFFLLSLFVIHMTGHSLVLVDRFKREKHIVATLAKIGSFPAHSS
jgi:hypothetical protein